MGTCEGEGGRLEGSWDLGGAFEVDPLPLVAMSSLRLLLPLFKAMSSSPSSEELSGQAITKTEMRTSKFLFDSPTASKRLIKGAFGLISSKQNSSISSSNERQDEVISSLGNASTSTRFCGGGYVASGRICGIGKATEGRSLRAKNPSLEASIRANLELLALIAWPMSWKVRDRGS